MAEKVQEQESGIVVHTLETDMADLGIETESAESTETETQETTEEGTPEKVEEKEVKEEEPVKKKETRAQRRIRRQQEENKRLKAELEELKTQKEQEEEEPNPEEIDIDDYESYDDYTEALAKAEEKPAKEPVKEEKEPVPFSQESLDDMFEDGNEDYKDFESKVKNPELVVSQQLLAEVLKMESPSDVLYALAAEPDKLKELSTLESQHDLIVELARVKPIKETAEKKAPAETKAPEPINPVNGSSIKGLTLDDDDLTFEQHAELLAKTQTHQRGGFI